MRAYCEMVVLYLNVLIDKQKRVIGKKTTYHLNRDSSNQDSNTVSSGNKSDASPWATQFRPDSVTFFERLPDQITLQLLEI